MVWKTLGEVGEVTKLAGFEFTNYIKYNDIGKIIALRGLNVKGSLDLSDVKYIDESDFSKLNRSKLYIDDMLFTYVGTVGSVALIPENDKYYLAPNVARIRFLDRRINPRFMFHYFQSDEFEKKQINRYLGSSSMKNLTMENIRKFQIPLPPLEEQQRIANILDKFDTLVNSISEGLPKEIALRRKQYEYYREKLLSFPS
ncbi:restriction endonuclease subunit S [Capnocytophaga ochracea]|uniref:restriction endonuclease subunit S n=1 Tax=Capnocytophaga ochracea TaxID=1018 RepID=UPI001C6A1AF8|nr:restriction endonuclease subunit S [Capnocytophaga ochracea]